MNKSSFTPKRIVLLITIAAAMFFALLALRNKLIVPFPLEIKYDTPTGGAMTENGDMLVVDSAGTRLVFCDSEGKVRCVENFDDTSAISKALKAKTDGDYFYVIGVKYERNTSIVHSEKYLRYDRNGKNCRVLFELISSGHDRITQLYDCSVYGDRLFYAMGIADEDDLGDRVAVFSINLNGKKDSKSELIFKSKVKNAFRSCYVPDENKLYTSNYIGELYAETKDSCIKQGLNGHSVRAFLPEKNGSIIYYDQIDWNLYCDQTVIDKKINLNNISSSSGYIVFDDENKEVLVRINKESGVRETFAGAGFSVPFALLTFLEFISVVYLFGLLVFFIIKFLIINFNKKNYDLLRIVGVIALGVIISLLISLFYTNNIYKLKVEGIKDQVSATSEFFADTLDPEEIRSDGENIDNILNSGMDSLEFIAKFAEYENYFNAYVRAEQKNGNYSYVAIYVKDGDRYRLLYDSLYDAQLGQSFYHDGYDADTTEYFDTVHVSSYNGLETMFKTTPLYDYEGKIVGIVEVGLDYTVFKKYAFQEMMEMTMSLLMMLAGVYIILSEASALYKGLRERKQRIAKGKQNPELSLIRPVNFLFCLVTSFDMVILVLISREMLIANNCPMDTITILMVLPSLSVSIGAFFGTLFNRFLSWRLQTKKLLVGAASFMAVCTLLLIPALAKNLFFIFCLLKLLGSIANTVIFRMLMHMRFAAENEKEIARANRNSNKSTVSSSILGTMIGGFVAQNWGNVSLYIINVIVYIPLIILLAVSIPKTYTVVRNTGQNKEKGILAGKRKYLFSIPMMTYFIFLVLPLALASGYKTYLFPLLAELMDMPKTYITNFYIFARVTMLILLEPMSRAIARLDSWVVSVVGMILLGLYFMGFAVNSTFVWAVIMLFIVVILESIINISKGVFWTRQAKASGLSLLDVNGIVWSVEQKIYGLKETILSAFLMLGFPGVFEGIGLVCILFTVIFAAVTSRSAVTENAGGNLGLEEERR